MKKILPALLLISLLGLFVVPTTAVLAQAGAPESCTIKHDLGSLEGVNCPGVGSECSFDDETYDCGVCCLLNAVYTVTDWIFILLVAFSAVMIMIGAFTLLTAAGVPEKVNAGRNYIIYAIIGLIVGLFAKAIPAVAKAIMGL